MMPLATRTRENPDLRKAQILEHAVALIGESGYYGFTVQALAKRCGLSNPGLLHYFPSKAHVLVAVLREMEVREAEVFAPLVHLAESVLVGDQAKAAVLEVLHVMVARSIAQPGAVRLMAELQAESLSPEHPAHAWWHIRETTLLAFLARLLAPHLADAQPTARQLVALMDGLAVQWLRAECAFDIVAEWKRALVRLLPELHGGHRT